MDLANSATGGMLKKPFWVNLIHLKSKARERDLRLDRLENFALFDNEIVFDQVTDLQVEVVISSRFDRLL